MLRVSCEISQCEPLSDRWDSSTGRKRQTIDIAQKMPDRYRERMEACSEWLKVQSFRNGHERLSKSWKCRVRGCPICEQALEVGAKKDLARILISAKKKYPTWLCSIFSFQKNCTPDDLKPELDLSRKLIRKRLKTKQFAGCEYTFKTSLSFGFGAVSIQHSVLVLHPRSKFIGNSYLSKKGLQTLFQAAEPSLVRNLTIDRTIVLPSRALDLSIASEAEIEKIVVSLHKVRLTGSSHGLSVSVQKKSAKKKTDFKPPSTYFAVFAPNPDNPREMKYSAVAEFDFEENLIKE